jgi:hypothetical protein
MQFLQWFGYAFMLLSATVLISIILWNIMSNYIKNQRKSKVIVAKSSDISQNEDEILEN